MKLHEVLKVSTTSKDQKAFVKDWMAMTKPHPFDDRQRVLGYVGVDLSPWQEDLIHIHSIISYKEKGSGEATAVMNKLKELAAKHHVKLEGTAKPIPLAGATNKKSLTSSQLKSWYKKLGFKLDGDHILYTP